MKYMGSKNRLSKYLLPIILKNRKPEQWYVEPFVGGFNLIDKVKGNRLASDCNFYLIELFKALQTNWIPPIYVSEKVFNIVKRNKFKYASHLVGYIGFNSFSGRFFRGYRRDSIGKRDYWKEHFNNIQKQRKLIKDIIIVNENYWDLKIPDKSIVYCDPPYQNMEEYKDDFDNNYFWNWIRQQVYIGHKVFVSEYTAPNDFKCIWEKNIKTTVSKYQVHNRVEKLFKYKGDN